MCINAYFIPVMAKLYFQQPLLQLMVCKFANVNVKMQIFSLFLAQKISESFDKSLIRLWCFFPYCSMKAPGHYKLSLYGKSWVNILEKMSKFVHHRKINSWSGMRVSKWWIHFWVNYPIKSLTGWHSKQLHTVQTARALRKKQQLLCVRLSHSDWSAGERQVDLVNWMYESVT